MVTAYKTVWRLTFTTHKIRCFFFLNKTSKWVFFSFSFFFSIDLNTIAMWLWKGKLLTMGTACTAVSTVVWLTGQWCLTRGFQMWWTSILTRVQGNNCPRVVQAAALHFLMRTQMMGWGYIEEALLLECIGKQDGKQHGRGATSGIVRQIFMNSSWPSIQEMSYYSMSHLYCSPRFVVGTSNK